MKFLKKFFKTQYRICKKDDRFVVQEHEWFDLIYGKWWHVNSSDTIEGAIRCLEYEKKRRGVKTVVVYEE